MGGWNGAYLGTTEKWTIGTNAWEASSVLPKKMNIQQQYPQNLKNMLDTWLVEEQILESQAKFML